MSSSTEQAQEDRGCQFKEHMDLLRELPFFSAMPLEAVKVLAYLTRTESFKEGEYIYAQGDEVDKAYLVRSGEIEVFYAQENCEPVQVKRLGSGDFFGGLALAGKVKSIFSLRVALSANCLVLEREKFIKTLERFPEMLAPALDAVVRHVLAWEERFMRLHAGECTSQGKEFGLTLF